MFCECQALIKSIDAYIKKEDDTLADSLKKAGFALPEKTVKNIEELEEKLAEIFQEQSFNVEELLKEAERNGVGLEDLIEGEWQGFKSTDNIGKKLHPLFFGKLSECIPELANVYMSAMDSELVVEQISDKTSGWIAQWSGELSDIMKLSSHEEIERVLSNALKNGKSVADLTEDIMTNGVRDEYYKARLAAITEMLRAHSVAKEESIQQCPAAEFKEWVHTGSYRNEPRANHEAISGQIVRKDKNFILKGYNGVTYLADFPRDSVLPPEESISCHCIHRGVVSQEILGLSLDERKRLQQQAIDEMNDNWKTELDEKNKEKAGITVDNSSGNGIINYGITYRTTSSGKVIAMRSIEGTYEIMLPNGSKSIIKNPTFDKYEVFAGKGSDKELRVKEHLVNNYGGKAENWFHAKGYTNVANESGETRKANVHWFEEETIGIKEIYIKGWSKK